MTNDYDSFDADWHRCVCRGYKQPKGYCGYCRRKKEAEAKISERQQMADDAAAKTKQIQADECEAIIKYIQTQCDVTSVGIVEAIRNGKHHKTYSGPGEQ